MIGMFVTGLIIGYFKKEKPNLFFSFILTAVIIGVLTAMSVGSKGTVSPENMAVVSVFTSLILTAGIYAGNKLNKSRKKVLG